MTLPSRPVVVVGGGLAGLVTAFRLVQAGKSVVVFEASGRLGGQIDTVREHGLVVEIGAEGFVSRSTLIPSLCRSLGIERELVDQRTTDTLVLTREGLVPLEPGEAARILGFQVAREDFGRGIRSFASGMGRLIDELRVAVERGGSIVVDAPASRIETERGTSVVLASGESVAAAAVVVAVPSVAAAALLESGFPEEASALSDAPLLSSVSVTLAYSKTQVAHSLEASGFVVPSETQDGFRACTFVSTKFAGRAPADTVLLRAFFRPSGEDMTTLTREDWVDRARAAVEPVLSIDGPPTLSWLASWPKALPVHDASHRESIRALEARLEGLPIWLAGSAFHGAGIDAAVESAERAAARVLAGTAA